jgi:hypothetical protein
MTAPTQTPAQDNTQSNKEINFRLQEKALQDKYERLLAQERSEKDRLMKELQSKQSQASQEDDDNSEPYVDEKRLNKKLAKFGEQSKQQTQSDINSAVQHALKEERKNNWIKSNPDFYEVLQHAEKFAQKDPELAETILEMPEGFERQKLVYKNIKALGLDRPEVKQPSIQEKVDANRRSPFYQPTSVGSSPYSSQADFSAAGQKNAYEKMQELKSKLRI